MGFDGVGGTTNKFLVDGPRLDGSTYNGIYISNYTLAPAYPVEVRGAYIANITDSANTTGSLGNCIVLYQVSGVSVHDNSCYNAQFSGVRVSTDAHDNIVASNRIDGAREGSMYAELGAYNNLFANNLIVNCVSGIHLTNVSNRPSANYRNIAIGNVVRGCLDYGAEAEADELVGNRFEDVSIGIILGTGNSSHNVALLNNTVVNTGSVTGLRIVDGGHSYMSPVLAFTGGGCTTQPTGSATPVGGVISSLVLITPGAGCTYAPTVKVTGTNTSARLEAQFSPLITAIAVDNSQTSASQLHTVDGNTLSGAALVNPIIGIDNAASPRVSAITSLSGTQTKVTFRGGNQTATAIPQTNDTVIFRGVRGMTEINGRTAQFSGTAPSVIARVVADMPGAGYSSATVSVTGGSCTTAPTVTATVSGGQVTGMTLTNAGAGCLIIPYLVVNGTSTNKAYGHLEVDETLNIDTSTFNTYDTNLATFNNPPFANIVFKVTATTPAYTVPAGVLVRNQTLDFPWIGTPANGSSIFVNLASSSCGTGSNGYFFRRLNGAWVCN